MSKRHPEILEARRLFSGLPSISISDVWAEEGNAGTTNAEVVVSLYGSRSNNKQGVTVNFATQNGSAIAGVDYTAVSGKLTFARGETSKTILVPVKGDQLVESNDHFFVNLSGAKGGKIAKGQGIVQIEDDEPYIYVTSYVAVQEGNSGNAAVDLTVSLSRASNASVSVDYTTVADSATAGSDFTSAAGTIVFAPGEDSKTITVQITGDTLVEFNESFNVNLSNASSNAAIGHGTATVVITDDEPRISIADVSQGYLADSLVFTVTLSASSTEVVTVNFATVDGIAIAGTDYVATSGTLTFAAGETSQTITVQIIDPASSGYKYMSITLSGANNAPIQNATAYGYWYYDWYYDPGYYDPGYGYYYDPYGYGYW